MDIQQEIVKRFKLQKEFLGDNKPVNQIEPLVSVTTTTYQHVNFIEDCIKGVLMQKTTFPIEFIIGEDGSTDGTREICERYAKQHPNKIRLFIRDRKISQLHDKKGKLITHFNSRFTKMSARGKYIAICEGDDYWTDPLKLQKQVEFLENNTDYSFCSGAIIRFDESKKEQYVDIKNIKVDESGYKGFSFCLEDMEKTWLCQPLTALIRRSVYELIDLTHYKYPRDVHLFYHLAKLGKGFYFTQIFGVYRIHSGGIHSKSSRMQRRLIAYEIYKELYKTNKDEFSRRKLLSTTTGILSAKLLENQNTLPSQSIYKLALEALCLVRTLKEICVFLSRPPKLIFLFLRHKPQRKQR
jgi:glycosyltransferase involved in cell wall biosynthesis